MCFQLSNNIIITPKNNIIYSLFVAYTGGVPNTVVDATPVIAEKPFFYVNARYLGTEESTRPSFMAAILFLELK